MARRDSEITFETQDEYKFSHQNMFPRQHSEEILRVLGQGQGRISSTRVLDLSYNNLGHVFPLLLDNLRFLHRAVLRGSLRRYKLVASVLTSLKMQGSHLKSLDLSENPLSGRDGWLAPALLASSVHHLEEIRLQRVHFTDNQVHALFSSLPGTLTVLDLGDVDLSPLPPPMVAQVAGVEEVNLTNTSLTKEQVEALLATLPPVKKKTNPTEDSKDTGKDCKNQAKDTEKDSEDKGKEPAAKGSENTEKDSKSTTKDSESKTKDSESKTKDNESKPKDPIIIMKRLSLQGNNLSGMILFYSCCFCCCCCCCCCCCGYYNHNLIHVLRCEADQAGGTNQLARMG